MHVHEVNIIFVYLPQLLRLINGEKAVTLPCTLFNTLVCVSHAGLFSESGINAAVRASMILLITNAHEHYDCATD